DLETRCGFRALTLPLTYVAQRTGRKREVSNRIFSEEAGLNYWPEQSSAFRVDLAPNVCSSGSRREPAHRMPVSDPYPRSPTAVSGPETRPGSLLQSGRSPPLGFPRDLLTGHPGPPLNPQSDRGALHTAPTRPTRTPGSMS